MQVRNFVAFVLGIAITSSSTAVAATTMPARPAVFQPRHADIAADARGRSLSEALERQQYRGPRPVVMVTTPIAVGRAQIAALGFPHVSPSASGLFVQVDVSDSTGQYRDLYVYDPQTHFIRYQIENVILPSVVHASKRKS